MAGTCPSRKIKRSTGVLKRPLGIYLNILSNHYWGLVLTRHDIYNTVIVAFSLETVTLCSTKTKKEAGLTQTTFRDSIPGFPMSLGLDKFISYIFEYLYTCIS